MKVKLPLGNTLLVGAATVACALVLGTLIAFWYQAHPGRLRNVLQAIVFLPFVLPPIMTGLSLLIFFREAGIPRSLVTVTIGHTTSSSRTWPRPWRRRRWLPSRSRSTRP
ncbi:MAG: hypothetical protein WAS21_08600 [Geminicoccaceae bacterium]